MDQFEEPDDQAARRNAERLLAAIAYGDLSGALSAEGPAARVAGLKGLLQRFETVRQAAGSTSPHYGQALLREAAARRALAEVGVEAETHLTAALQQVEEALPLLEPNSPDRAHALLDAGNTQVRLAELEINPEAHLHAALECYQAARRGFAANAPHRGLALANEGVARRHLAERDETPEAHLEEALRLFAAAREVLEPDSLPFHRAQLGEGLARQSLAELGSDDPVEQLEAAVRLFRDAREAFEATRPDYGRAAVGEAVARQSLAELGENTKENLEAAVELCRDARQAFIPGSPDYAAADEYERVATESLKWVTSELKPGFRTLLTVSIPLLVELEAWAYEMVHRMVERLFAGNPLLSANFGGNPRAMLGGLTRGLGAPEEVRGETRRPDTPDLAPRSEAQNVALMLDLDDGRILLIETEEAGSVRVQLQDDWAKPLPNFRVQLSTGEVLRPESDGWIRLPPGLGAAEAASLALVTEEEPARE